MVDLHVNHVNLILIFSLWVSGLNNEIDQTSSMASLVVIVLNLKACRNI